MKQSLDIKAISHRHIRQVDKFFRMFGGLSSELTDYSNRTLELEIRIDQRWSRSKRGPEATARQLAESWRMEPELSGAKHYRVFIYRANRPSGACFSVNATPAELAALIKRLGMDEPHPDVLLAKVTGTFDQHE